MATGATLVLTIFLDEVYEPLIHLEPVERPENTHLRDHSKPDPARQPEKYRDKFKGLRVFVIKHPQYKGRFGYVLDSHSSNSTANVALDGLTASRITNEHSVPLECLVSVYVLAFDAPHPIDL